MSMPASKYTAMPFEDGEAITIHHVGGSTHVVKIRYVDSKCAFVNWPLAGDYKVSFDTGQLSKKTASLWSLSPDDLQRLRETRSVREQEHKKFMKVNKGGQ